MTAHAFSCFCLGPVHGLCLSRRQSVIMIAGCEGLESISYNFHIIMGFPAPQYSYALIFRFRAALTEIVVHLLQAAKTVIRCMCRKKLDAYHVVKCS